MDGQCWVPGDLQAQYWPVNGELTCVSMVFVCLKHKSDCLTSVSEVTMKDIGEKIPY